MKWFRRLFGCRHRLAPNEFVVRITMSPVTVGTVRDPRRSDEIDTACFEVLDMVISSGAINLGPDARDRIKELVKAEASSRKPE